jgi:hypothetical protein
VSTTGATGPVYLAECLGRIPLKVARARALDERAKLDATDKAPADTRERGEPPPVVVVVFHPPACPSLPWRGRCRRPSVASDVHDPFQEAPQ